MRMHALNTGSMSVKRRYVEAVGKMRLLRLTAAVVDTQFVDIPVFTWVIEHPEGLIVVDTGLTAAMTNPEFFPSAQRPYYQSQYRFHVQPEDEIGSQMQRLGLRPEDVRWVIMTHAHFDHSANLDEFRGAEVMFTRQEWNDVQRFRSAHFDFPAKYPRWLNPRLVDFTPQRIGPFTEAFTLTEAGDVHLVPTPGHTMGHQSVVLQDGDLTYFFAGDASFDQPSLLNGKLDAPAFNSIYDLETRRRIVQYARQAPMVYLSTHDPHTSLRLEQKTTVFESSLKLPM